MAGLFHQKLASLFPLSFQEFLKGLGLRAFGTCFRANLRRRARAGFLLNERKMK